VEIEKAFHIVVTLTDISMAPTIHQLAALMDGPPERPSPGALVPLQPAGERPALFLLPGLGGHVIGFRELALLLGPEHPVYGLELSGRQTPHHRVEDLASDLVEEILRRFPLGPYYLIGFSAGGMIAYEMAQQLQQRGQDIALLALLDTYGPDYPRLSTLPRRLGQHLWRFLALPLAAKGPYFAERCRRLADRFIPRQQSEPATADALPGSTAAATATTSRKILEMLRDYRPQPYRGSITILKAGTTPDWIGTSFDDPNMGWTPLIQGQIHACLVSGTHLEIVRKPGVQVLATQLRQTIHQAWQRQTGTARGPAASR
jgi:thioesterase domain-containing protein